MSAGLAALATFLKGGGQIAGKVIEEQNRSIAGRNRDEVMRWAEDASMEWANEQRKIEEANKRLAAVGMPVPQDVGQAKAFYASQGVNPAAVGTTPEQFAAAAAPSPLNVVDEANKQGAIAAGMDSKQADATGKVIGAKRELAGQVGKIAASTKAATDVEGGQASMEERTTKRQWNDPLASSLLPEATRFMSSTLQRQERGTGDLDAEERRLVKKMGLAQGYSSYLQKEDLESIRESLKGLSDARRDRIMEDKGVRGDQVQIGTGLIGYGRAMEQTATAAEARAQLEDKKIGSRERIAGQNNATRRAIAGARLAAQISKDDRDFIAKSAETDRKNLADANRNKSSLYSALGKTKKKDEKVRILNAYGIPASLQDGFFSSPKILSDESAFNAHIQSLAQLAEESSGRLRDVARVQAGERAGGGGEKATSGKSLPAGWVRGPDGVMRKQTK